MRLYTFRLHVVHGLYDGVNSPVSCGRSAFGALWLHSMNVSSQPNPSTEYQKMYTAANELTADAAWSSLGTRRALRVAITEDLAERCTL